jgi:hypothetical protein
MRTWSRCLRDFSLAEAVSIVGFTLQESGQRSQRPNTVACNREHGHREGRPRNTPHPEPEDERDDDQNGIEVNRLSGLILSVRRLFVGSTPECQTNPIPERCVRWNRVCIAYCVFESFNLGSILRALGAKIFEELGRVHAALVADAKLPAPYQLKDDFTERLNISCLKQKA